MQSQSPLQNHSKAIELDYGNMMSEFIGSDKGITIEELDKLTPIADLTAEKVNDKRDSGEFGFYQLPYDSATTNSILRMAETYNNRFDDFVILGIAIGYGDGCGKHLHL